MICLLGLLGACGNDGENGTAAGSSGSSGSAGDATAGELTSSDSVGDTTADGPTGGSPTGGGPTETSSADGSSGEPDEPTGGGESHRVCDLYLNCLAVIAPTELPDAQQGFGPDGTCWQGDEGSAQQCIAACEAGLATWHDYDPSATACWLCQAPTDCPEGQACEAGECKTGGVSGCGNGVVDADEICDGGKGCDADCLGPAECSPGTLAGCAADEVCLFQAGSDPSCESSDAGLPEVGDVCDPYANEMCAEGLFCASVEIATDCPAPGCCVPFCYDGKSCPGGDSCLPNFGTVTTPGLDYLGYCV